MTATVIDSREKQKGRPKAPINGARRRKKGGGKKRRVRQRMLQDGETNKFTSLTLFTNADQRSRQVKWQAH